jgi:hypothetical protein
MVDKTMTLRRADWPFGEAGDQLMLEIGRLLAVFLALTR